MPSIAETTYLRLNEEFPREMERTLNKGGARLTYIPQAEVIARLNNVLGVDGWSMEVIRAWREPSNEDAVLAHVRITATIGGRTVVRDGFGGQKINTLKSGGPVDLGDDFKGAVSDAMKKAATTLGVALYLARDADALEIEAAQQADVAQAEPSEEWKAFTEQVGMLTAEGKAAINTFWSEYGGGRPKPTATSYTAEDLAALTAEAVRLILDGQYVNDAP